MDRAKHIYDLITFVTLGGGVGWGSEFKEQIDRFYRFYMQSDLI